MIGIWSIGVDTHFFDHDIVDIFWAFVGMSSTGACCFLLGTCFLFGKIIGAHSLWSYRLWHIMRDKTVINRLVGYVTIVLVIWKAGVDCLSKLKYDLSCQNHY